MYNELINALRHCAECDHQGCAADCRFGKEHPLNFICIEYLQREAADAIEELQTYLDLYKDIAAENQRVARKVIDSYPRWIPVSERLPEDENHVLAATRNKKGNYNIVKAYYCHDMGVWAAGMNNNVTHWMPLPPEPPKESEA